MRYFTHIVAVALASLSIVGCSKNKMSDVTAVVNKGPVPSETSVNARLLYSDSAVLRLLLEAPQLDRYPGTATGDSSYVEFPKGIHVEFYGSDGEVETTLDADWAVQYEKEGFMEARRDVVVVNRDGETLNTEHLHWDRLKRRIHSDEFVKITTSEEVLWGDGLDANEDFTQYKILNPRGSMLVKEAQESDSTQTKNQTEQPKQ